MILIEKQPTYEFGKDNRLNEFARTETLESIKSQLRDESSLSPESQNIVHEAKNLLASFSDSEAVVVSELAKLDKGVSLQIHTRIQYSSILEDNLNTRDVGRPEDFLLNISEFIKIITTDASLAISEDMQKMLAGIQLGLERNDEKRVRKFATQLSEHLRNTHEQWKAIVKDPDIPQELVDNVEEINQAVKLREVLLFIEQKTNATTQEKRVHTDNPMSQDEKKAIRANILVPLLQDNFEPELILDLIEGKYDLDDPTWFGNFTESYLQFIKSTQKVEAKKKNWWPAKLAIVGSILALAGTLIFNPFVKDKRMDKLIEKQKQSEVIKSLTPEADGNGENENDGDSEANGENSQEISPENEEEGGDPSGKIKKADAGDQNSSGQGGSEAQPGGGAGNGGAGEGGGTSGEGGEASGAGPGGAGESGSESGSGPSGNPSMEQTRQEGSLVQPEGGEALDETIYWEIEGEIPSGYFWNDSSSAFAYDNWKYEYSMTVYKNLPLEDESAPTRINSAIEISNAGQYPIPIPKGWEITSINAGSVQGDLYVSNTGAHFFKVEQNPSNPDVITYSLQPIENFQDTHDRLLYSDLETRETLDTSLLLGDVEKLPPEVRDLLDGIRDSDQTTAEKAQAVRNMVRSHFIYSLDPKYTQYYAETTIPGEFVRRAWDIGFADCDPVNTVNVAFLRYVGIDARLGQGYMNGSALFSASASTLEGNERHAWAEFYDPVTMRWEVSDATPGEVDEEAAMQLEGINGGAGIEEVFKNDSPENIQKSLGLMLAKIINFETSTEGIVTDSVLAITLYIILSYMGLRREAKNRNLAYKIVFDMQAKAWDDKPGSPELYNLVTTLTNKILPTLLTQSPFEAYKFIERVQLIPRIKKTNIDHAKLQQIAERTSQLATTEPIELGQESVTAFFQRSIGVEPSVVKKAVGSEIVKVSLKEMYDLISQSLRAKFHNELLRNNHELARLPINKLCKDMPNQNDFIYACLDKLYQDYLIAFNSAIKLRAKSKKNPPRHTKTIQEKISVTAEPLGQIEFVQLFADEVGILLRYHQTYNADRPAVANDRATNGVEAELNQLLSEIDALG